MKRRNGRSTPLKEFGQYVWRNKVWWILTTSLFLLWIFRQIAADSLPLPVVGIA